MTTATVRCTQPGCDGTIQDGYCDTCGLAAPASSSAASGPSGSAGSALSASSPGSSRSTRSRARGRGTSRSARHAPAQIAAVRILVSGDGQGVTGDALRQASGQLAQLVVDDARRQQLTVEILRAALDWCTSGQPAGGSPILGCEPNVRALRFGLERSYRALARLTPETARRVELADLANAIRPRTLT
jgi:Protein kinase G tetratricopeptide repeat